MNGNIVNQLLQNSQNVINKIIRKSDAGNDLPSNVTTNNQIINENMVKQIIENSQNIINKLNKNEQKWQKLCRPE